MGAAFRSPPNSPSKESNVVSTSTSQQSASSSYDELLNRRPPSADYRCRQCGEPGHWTNYCPTKAALKIQSMTITPNISGSPSKTKSFGDNIARYYSPNIKSASHSQSPNITNENISSSENNIIQSQPIPLITESPSKNSEFADTEPENRNDSTSQHNLARILSYENTMLMVLDSLSIVDKISFFAVSFSCRDAVILYFRHTLAYIPPLSGAARDWALSLRNDRATLEELDELVAIENGDIPQNPSSINYSYADRERVSIQKTSNIVKIQKTSNIVTQDTQVIATNSLESWLKEYKLLKLLTVLQENDITVLSDLTTKLKNKTDIDDFLKTFKTSFILQKRFKKNVLELIANQPFRFNVVSSTKREYIIPELKDNDHTYLFQGGSGYEKGMISIKTTIVHDDAKEDIFVKAAQYSEKLCADPNHKIILICGKTGAGKTTVINSMMNYIYGVRIDDRFRLKLIEEKKKRSGNAASCTDHIASYTLKKPEHGAIDYDLTIIDTPGFGDTRGITKDMQTLEEFKYLFSSMLIDVNAICFVVNASDNRLDANQTYVFNNILNLWAKNVEENIFILMTFADGGKPKCIDAFNQNEVLKNCKQKFLMNNAAFTSNPYDDEKTPEIIYKKYWEMGITCFTDFFRKLGEVRPKKIEHSKQVLNKRCMVKQRIHKLQQQFNSLFKTQSNQNINNIDQQIDAVGNLKQELRTIALRPQLTTMGKYIDDLMALESQNPNPKRRSLLLKIKEHETAATKFQESDCPYSEELEEFPLDIDTAVNTDIQFGIKTPAALQQQIRSMVTNKNGFVKIDPSIITSACALLVAGYSRETVHVDIENIVDAAILMLIQKYTYCAMLICSNENLMTIQSGGENPSMFVVTKKDWAICYFTTQLFFYDAEEMICFTKVPPETLEHVVIYVSHHKGIEPDPLPCPVRSIHMSQIVSDQWDAKWIDAFGKKTIFEIILAANYLDIKSLLHLGCAKIATLIKQLDQGEMNRIIEEEERYRREHCI